MLKFVSIQEELDGSSSAKNMDVGHRMVCLQQHWLAVAAENGYLLSGTVSSPVALLGDC